MQDGTREEIMRATYRALCEHGYADVTMQAIADESGKSTAALHYHYDTKRELLLAFLDFLAESFVERLDDADEGSPTERLVSVIEATLSTPDDDPEFGTIVLETKARAPYDDGFRDHQLRIDDHLHARFRSIVEDGIDEGTFDPAVDPDETAQFLTTLVGGCHTRQVATGRDLGPVRRQLHDYVRTTLLADDRSAEAEVLTG
jgi:AcrR family transcriptional regulator